MKNHIITSEDISKSSHFSHLNNRSFKATTSNNPMVKKDLNLVEVLKKAKNKDEIAIVNLIKKYDPLVNKYSRIYKLKDYEEDDLKQEATMAIMNAIEKFDLSKNPNTFDGYTINSIKNKYGTLARKHIKRNDESSLNIITNEDSSELISLIEDPINIENNYVKTSETLRLQAILNTLSKEELDLINAVYLKKSHSLLKYCKEKNINYANCRRQLKKSLEKLKQLLQ